MNHKKNRDDLTIIPVFLIIFSEYLNDQLTIFQPSVGLVHHLSNELQF